MNERVTLAVPSNGSGGLEAERSGHFGHCDCFTIVEIENGTAGEARVVPNLEHIEGGCLRPVQMLAAEGVNAIIVAGIGPRPLAGFNEAGITVYFDDQLPHVGEAVAAVAAGTARPIDPSHACRH